MKSHPGICTESRKNKFSVLSWAEKTLYIIQKFPSAYIVKSCFLVPLPEQHIQYTNYTDWSNMREKTLNQTLTFFGEQAEKNLADYKLKVYRTVAVMKTKRLWFDPDLKSRFLKNIILKTNIYDHSLNDKTKQHKPTHFKM